MIYGIGTDIVAVARFESIWQRHGRRCLSHLLADAEVHELPEKQVARFLAKRFAAKEAFAKAAGTGLRYPVSLNHISIQHDALGKPSLVFAAVLQDWLIVRGVVRHHVSISDEQHAVVAMVILEAKE